jgi:hypothetical protein
MNRNSITIDPALVLSPLRLDSPVPAALAQAGQALTRSGQARAKHEHGFFSAPVGYITVALFFCLLLWGFASPAAAATIVVTTNQDVVDPPFNTGGLCGTGSISNLPGVDGKVSLREAIIAANHTLGAKTVTFAPALNGATIVLTGSSLALCGGYTTLNGDVNGDDTPDITVDGSTLTSDIIDIVSSHNTVKNLRVRAPQLASLSNPGVAGIAIVPSLAVATTVMDNIIAHNSVSGSIVVAAGSDVFNNRKSINATTIKHAIVQDNTVVGGPFGILAFNFGAENVITDLTIAGNTVSGTTGLAGIFMAGGWQNPLDPTNNEATDNRIDVVIRDNTSTGNNVPGNIAGIDILGGALLASHNQVTAQVLNNTVTNNIGAGMSAAAAARLGSSDNSLDIIMRNNTVTGNSLPGGPGGIEVLGGGISSSGNHVTAKLIENTITDNDGIGVNARAGLFNSSHNRADVLIRGNTIMRNSNPGRATGIAVEGGLLDSSDNQTTTDLLDNTITGNNGAAIVTLAGQDNSFNNRVDVKIRGNTLENNQGAGIAALGGLGAAVSPTGDSSGNSLDARIEHNTVKNAVLFGLWVSGGIGSLDGAPSKVANGNEVNAIVTDNTVTGTFGEGMHLDAGGSGVANNNDVDVTVSKNTVCGSAATDIHAIGGFLGIPSLLPLPNQGTGNSLEGEISKNTATTVVVENGVVGNSATVTQSKNVPCP